MKRKTIITLIFAALLAGCEYLDYSEHSFYTDPEEIFSNFARTRQFLTDIYSRLPDDFNSVGGAMRSAAGDEAEYVEVERRARERIAVQVVAGGRRAFGFRSSTRRNVRRDRA